LELPSAILLIGFVVNGLSIVLISAALDEVEYAPQIEEPRAFDLTRFTNASALDFSRCGEFVEFRSAEPCIMLRTAFWTANPDG
jgi:hypothetical protein